MVSSLIRSSKMGIAVLAALIVGTLFLTTPIAFAHETGSSAGVGAPKPLPLSNVASSSERAKDRMASSTNAAGKTLSTALMRAIDMTIKTSINRLNAAVDRLTNISGRIGTRIDKLTTDGVNTTNAKALHATAKAKIDVAKAKIALIVKPTAPTNPTAEGAREAYKTAFETLRLQVKAADEAIRDAQKALEDVLKEIRRAGGAKADVDAHATSTATNH